MINTSNPGENLCGLKKADFQKVIDGKQTDLFILKNENGAEVAITNYGGAVAAIMVPDKEGNYANKHILCRLYNHCYFIRLLTV